MKFTALAYGVLISHTILLTISSGFSAENTGTKLEKTSTLNERGRASFPLNLARTNLGAGIVSSREPATGDAPSGVDEKDIVMTAQNLISSDESLSYPLEKGKTSFIITLPFIAANREFSFINDNGSAGKVTISVARSAQDFNSTKWKKISEATILSHNSYVSVTFPMVEFTTMKVDFDITKPGRINAFGVFGETKKVGFTERPELLQKLQPIHDCCEYDYATLNNNQAYVSHISSYATPENYKRANVMLDDNASTSYDFAKNDPTPATIINLGQSQSIRRISSVYAAEEGILEFYALDKLPDGNMPSADSAAKEPQLLILPSDFFHVNRPIYTSETRPYSRKSSTTFELRPAKYVMLRWLPKKNATASLAPRDPAELFASTSRFFTLPSLLGQITPAAADTFRIFEVNVFGNTTRKRYAIDRGRERALAATTRPQVLIPINPLPLVSP